MEIDEILDEASIYFGFFLSGKKTGVLSIKVQ